MCALPIGRGRVVLEAQAGGGLPVLQVAIGRVTRDRVKPRQAARGWRIEDSAAAPARLAGWELSSELPGFHKVSELKRRLGESRPVGQLVYSDGLAAVSVFIEPLEGRRDLRTGLSSMGA